jgi:hypothetical protein
MLDVLTNFFLSVVLGQEEKFAKDKKDFTRGLARYVLARAAPSLLPASPPLLPTCMA